MASKKKILDLPETEFETVVVNEGVNAEAIVEKFIETDPAIINPYTAELKWEGCHPLNHAGLMFTFPKITISLDGVTYGPNTVLLTTPALERIYALPKETFDFLFGTKR